MTGALAVIVAVPVEIHCAKPSLVSILATPEGDIDQVAVRGVTVTGALSNVPVAVNCTPPNGKFAPLAVGGLIEMESK